MALTKRVILSAGHGNGDPGAIGQGTTEANETVQITERVAAYLRSWNFPEVVIEPHDVGSLVDEINWVNARYKSLESGYAIQIHKNSGGGNGSEVWYPSGGDDFSRNSASIIAQEMAASTGQPNRGIKDASTNRWGRLGWTDDTLPYALLVEAGFIDVNPVNDAADDRYAYGIAKGIMRIFGLNIPPQKKLATVDEVKQAYRDILEREADAGGLKTYANSKFTIEEVRADLLASDEYKTLQANKVKFNFVGAKNVAGRKFKFIKDAQLVNIPDSTRATKTGKLDYKVNEILEFAELLHYQNSKGEQRMFYRTKFWADRNEFVGFEAGSLQEFTPPAPEPEPKPSKDDEQDKRLGAIEAFIELLKAAWKKIFNRNIGE